jgi:hypothetical protein
MESTAHTSAAPSQIDPASLFLPPTQPLDLTHLFAHSAAR